MRTFSSEYLSAGTLLPFIHHNLLLHASSSGDLISPPLACTFQFSDF